MNDVRPDNLKPTLWRTCRVIANKPRLRIMRGLLEHPGRTVTAIAASHSLSVSVACRYLRDLNARGLLRAERTAGNVRYWPHADESMKQSRALFASIWATMSNHKTPVDFIFRQSTAFTHPRRMAIVRQLSQSSLSMSDIQRKVAVSRAAVQRHLSKLIKRGFVTHDAEGHRYLLAVPATDFQRTLLDLATGD